MELPIMTSGGKGAQKKSRTSTLFFLGVPARNARNFLLETQRLSLFMTSALRRRLVLSHLGNCNSFMVQPFILSPFFKTVLTSFVSIEFPNITKSFTSLRKVIREATESKTFPNIYDAM